MKLKKDEAIKLIKRETDLYKEEELHKMQDFQFRNLFLHYVLKSELQIVGG